MSTEQSRQDNETAHSPGSPAGSDVNKARRRFTMAGLAGSGVIMTLTTRSALASNAISPSGFVSVNQSRHGAIALSQARLPTYWSQATHWPVDKQTKFGAIFHQCSQNSTCYQASVQDVISGKVAIDLHGSSNAGQYLVAAYLNALMGWTEDFLNTSQCITMGNEWLTTGVFHPTANVTWNSAQIVHYFQSTQT